LFDHPALARHRSPRTTTPAMFLHELAARQISERLTEVNRTFTKPAIVTAFPDIWADFLPGATRFADHENLHLPDAGFDLIVHGLSLHWSNDPVGQIIQCRRALRPDGLFLAALFGGETLTELRQSLARAESAVSGGLSPRVAPMAGLRDLGALLVRAGFALPVADREKIGVRYRSLVALMHDLRAMGETNAMADRRRSFTPRALFDLAEQIYADEFGDGATGIPATFEIAFLTGWAPDESQQKPLRPGSATTRLADALHSVEQPAGDFTPGAVRKNKREQP